MNRPSVKLFIKDYISKQCDLLKFLQMIVDTRPLSGWLIKVANTSGPGISASASA